MLLGPWEIRSEPGQFLNEANRFGVIHVCWPQISEDRRPWPTCQLILRSQYFFFIHLDRLWQSITIYNIYIHNTHTMLYRLDGFCCSTAWRQKWHNFWGCCELTHSIRGSVDSSWWISPFKDPKIYHELDITIPASLMDQQKHII